MKDNVLIFMGKNPEHAEEEYKKHLDRNGIVSDELLQNGRTFDAFAVDSAPTVWLYEKRIFSYNRPQMTIIALYPVKIYGTQADAFLKVGTDIEQYLCYGKDNER